MVLAAKERTNIGNSLLFVDDEPSIRLTLPPILEESGFQIRIADSVQSALQEISNHKFDILLSDLNINEPRDGFLVVKAARAANPRCVAILLTGYPDFDSAVEGINGEVDGYLVKPADIEKLLKTIEQKLAGRMLRKS
jgi:DNA-binding NtrC family response regulator